MNKAFFKILMFVALFFSINLSAQEADSLRHYLRVAAENNPEVKANFLAYRASLEKLPQAGAYEDPTLEVGFFFEPMDIIGGKQVADFTLMQMFPWFGTKKAAKTEAMHMSQAAFEQFRETRDTKFLEVYTQWYLLGSLHQKLVNNEENKKLLLQLKDLSQIKFSSPTTPPSASYTPPASSASAPMNIPLSSAGGGMSGMSGMGGASASSTAASAPMSGGMAGMSGGGSMGGSSSGMSEVLRIELEIIELESNIETLKSEIETEKAKFNALLNRPVYSPLLLPTTLEQVTYLFDPSTMDQIKANNPMLEMLVEEGKAYKAMGEMNKKMSYPMFGIGVQYMLNKKTNDPMFAMGSMNGKDMIMPMISVSIPIYRNKYKAQQRESKLWWDSNQEKYANTVNTLETDLERTRHQLNDAARKIDLFKRQSQIAQVAYNLAVREFASGKNDLTNIIQVHRQLLDYKLKEAESTASYNTMVANIQKLISFSEFDQFNAKQ